MAKKLILQDKNPLIYDYEKGFKVSVVLQNPYNVQFVNE